MAQNLDIGALQSGSGLDIGPLQSPSSTNQTVSPGGVASSFAAGTPYIVIPAIIALGVASSFAAGTPTLLGGNQSISPGGVISGLAIGVPLVAGGAIMPGGVASHFAAGQPFINQQEIIGPTGVASSFVAGTARVALVQSILVSGVATSFAAGTPTVEGAVQFLLAVGVGPGLIGVPAILGGPPELSILVGGIPIPSPAAAMALATQDPDGGSGGSNPTITSQTIGRWQAQFDLRDSSGTFAPALGQTVIFTENNFKLFAGCLVDVKAEWLMGTTQDIIYHCTAADKSSICDHRVVKSGTFLAGSDAAQAILAIVQQYLNGEGITAQGVPIDLGALTADQIFNFNTVTQAFDAIATDTGTIWYIDVNGILNFSAFNDLPPAPFSLSATSGNFRHFVFEQSLLNYRNSQYAVSNLTILPGAGNTGGSQPTAKVETFTWALGQPGIVESWDQFGNPIPGFLNTALPVSVVTSITVNGAPQTVVEFANFHGQQPTGPTDHMWFYKQQQVEMGPTRSLPLPVNATVIVSYIPFTNNASVEVGTALDPTSPITGGTFGTCGSGVYEAVEQVQNISTSADLTAIAQAVLNRWGGVPTVVTFETDKAGLAPGQLLSVNLPLISPIYLTNASLLITQVHGVSLAGDLGFGNSFRWTVQAQSVRDLGNWIKWFENLVKRTQNALPVYQYEIAAFVLAPGSSLAGGTVQTNPYIVKRTGLLYDMYASADSPPQDQDLILQFFVNGALIPGSVVIPANSASKAQFRFTFPTSSPIYVFAGSNFNDIITVQATYSVSGPSPLPASNVSYDIRWRM